MSAFASIPPEEWLASNELAFAFYDRFPVNPGHILVVTKRVVTTWWDATRDEQLSVLDLVDAVKQHLDLTYSPDGFNVGFNAGVAAGQTVDHLHVHVIPRITGDVQDPRGGIRHVIPQRANYLAPNVEERPARLVTPEGGQLYSELKQSFASPSYDQIDLIVSFVMRSGVKLLEPHIDAALERGASVRLLTTDYLLITDVSALGFFLDRLGPHRSGGSLEARVFSAPVSFHPKAYIFSSSAGPGGLAFLGSSNMSVSGLRTGVEWNLESNAVGELRDEFQSRWDDGRSALLTEDWLEDYRQRCEAAAERQDGREAPVADEEPEAPIRPWSVQREALAALEATRLEGHRAGLVVMATGLGKTWLAGFDSTRPSVRRVLFVAHREEILRAARDVYRRIRPGGSLTMFVGDEHDRSGDVVFASIQSLQRNLEAFAPDEFDYIVVDEFHHAAAPTYRQVIGHFEPVFMLGLTATPDRTDAADLLALCGDNLVYECGLVKGLERELLSPFRYRAIKDVADYAEIPWRSGRFDVEALSEQLETQQRAQQVLDEWSKAGGSGRRALGFCCSIRHADFMARFFAARGIRAVSVHTGPTSAPRTEALERLEIGSLDVVFSVDLFNEGIDVPSVDLVMMLRPTESPIVFFQQLGRGLRRSDGKEHLQVIDLVGNHRSFLLKARLLAALAGLGHLTDREAVERLQEPLTDLPDGCSIIVETEALDLLTRLLGAPRREDRLAELARAWAADHGGERPRALELAMVTNKAHDVKKLGGWFGFLDGLGLLSDDEGKVLSLAGDLFLWIEHGSYTKSYKLVTLQALLDLGTLRADSAISEVALSARWRMFRDPRLLADLSDATSQFGDVANPSEAEWVSYWLKNPINALTGGNTRGTTPWFSLDGDRLSLDLAVPEALGETFEAMVGEIVEYRLHRYLVGQDGKRQGERLQPRTADGTTLDAGFSIEGLLGRPTSILFESAGGAGPSGDKRNPDYVAGIDLVLERLKDLGAVVLDAYVDSGRVRELPIPDRRLDPGDAQFPVDLRTLDDLAAMRRSLLASMARVGRDPNAKAGGGNSRKAMRLIIGGLEHLDVSAAAGELTSPTSGGGGVSGVSTS